MRLENTTGGSSKFWEATVDGKTTTIRYGKIGTDGQTLVKKYGSAAEAQAAVAKAHQEKIHKGYVDADAFGVSQQKTAASGVTDKGGAKKGNGVAAALSAANGPKVPLNDLKTFAFYFNRVSDDFKTFRQAIDKHKDPGPDDKFGFLREIAPELKQQIRDKEKETEALFSGTFSELRKPTEKTTATDEALTALGQALKDLDVWREGIKLSPLALGMSDQSEYNFKDALKLALSYLPKLPPAGLANLSPAAFSKLEQNDQREVFQKYEGLGYTLDVHSDADAKKLATKIIGPERVKALLEQVRERAQDDSDAYDHVKIGKPSIAYVEAIKNGDEPLGYKISAYVNWQPADNDLLVDWMVDAKGKLFDEDFR